MSELGGATPVELRGSWVLGLSRVLGSWGYEYRILPVI